MDYEDFERILNSAFIENNLDDELEIKLRNSLKISFHQHNQNKNYFDKTIDNYDGPHINVYLQGYPPTIDKKVKFKSLEEAVKAANNCEYCSGITMTRQKIFTLRMGRILKESDKKNKYKNIELTWIKNTKTKEEIFNDEKEKENEIIKETNFTEIKCEIVKYIDKEYYYYQPERLMICKETNDKFILKRGKLSREHN